VISFNFNIESPTATRERLMKGYRARRNFAIYTLLSMIVEQTPVLTGLARGNWQISIGAPPIGTTNRLDPDGSVTPFEEISKLGGVSPFANVFIGNNLDYIDDLENGTSGQAPEGIVRVVVPAFRAMNADVI
jgi:hypothetical protein